MIKAPEAWQKLNNNSTIVNGTSPDNVFGASDIIITVYDNGLETSNGVPIHNGFKGNIKNGSVKSIRNIDVGSVMLDGYNRDLFP